MGVIFRVIRGFDLWNELVEWSYDTIRYDTVYLRALKSWRDGQPNLAHGTEQKKIRKNN